MQEEEVHLIRLRTSPLQPCLRKERRLHETFYRCTPGPIQGGPNCVEAAARGRVDAALRFCRFRCACRVKELGNLNISELVSRIRTSSVTLRDERRSNKGFAGLTQSDGQITDGQLQKIIVRAHKMPSIACAVSDRPGRCFEDLLGIFQLQERTGQGQCARLSIGRNGGP